ncbi:hypothetical protein [Pyxidicoccus xibeiensis]|uniref:hypothetical protein n=1 Tax=Pyxidicoccus xibeiensis TaxID=2906759 RepID=UPI003899A57F
MNAEASRRGRWALLVAVTPLAGCASTPHGASRPSGAAWREGQPFFAATVEAGTAGPLPSLSSSMWEHGSGGEALPCGGVPRGWPHLDSSEELLAPFLTCGSPAEFVALQRGVDMSRLVEALDDWSAVRLGALGPVGTEAARVLNRKRAAFLVTATEKYGVGLAEVFALFILHSAFDDDLRQVLVLLSRDKQLGQTLGRMGTVREELERRGLKLSEYPDRDERAGDVLRGLGRVGRDALATSEAVQGLQGAGLYARREHLPPPYQEAKGRPVQPLAALRKPSEPLGIRSRGASNRHSR